VIGIKIGIYTTGSELIENVIDWREGDESKNRDREGNV
jgi:hypothetical protein